MRDAIPNSSPTVRSNIALLANVDSPGVDGGRPTKNFGNILEIALDRLVLESSREHRTGDVLTLSLVFPGLGRFDNPIVSLSCTVGPARDASKLHYHLTIQEMNSTARERLTEYLAKAPVAVRT